MESLALAQDSGEKLTLEKFADGGIACLRFIGTIDESFEGKKIAATIKCETLLLDLGGVRKISSFGIREWVDFITAAGKQAPNVVLVECGPKIIDQLNMVANFAGSGRVYSFYAPYRCDYCDAEHRVLFTFDRDFEAIKAMKLGTRPCPTCKDAMYFDEDPASFFSYLLSQERFELSPEMETFLAARLNYAVSDVARKLRLDKLIEGRTTYVRFAGDLDASFPREKLADGLEGPVILDVAGIGRIEPAGAAEWRGLVQTVTPIVEQLDIVGAGPSFVEKLTRRDDLGTKGQVLSISLPYRCAGCGTSSNHTLDVEQHYDVIKQGRAPELRCAHCKAALTCAAADNVLAAMGMLPKPSVTPEAKKLAFDLAGRKLEKKKAPSAALAAAALAASQLAPPPPVRGGGMATGVVSALVAIVLVGGGVAAYQLLLNKPAAADLGKVSAASDPTRPAWITSDATSSSSCSEAEGGLSCIGVSSLAAVQDDAVEEARDVALDAVAEAVSQRIQTPEWKNATAVWDQARVAKLGALEANPTGSQARRDVRQARRAVASLLLASSGGAVVPTPTSRYWEERSNKDGKQYLAFARFTVPAASIEKMTAAYSATGAVDGATVVGLFPLAGWRYPGVDHGVIVVGLGAGRLKERGVAEQFVVLEVGGRKVTGTESFAKLLPEEVERLQATGGTLELTVQAGDGAPRAFTDLIAKKTSPTPANPGRNPGGRNPGGSTTSGNVNVWDRVGGGSGGRDDPNQ